MSLGFCDSHTPQVPAKGLGKLTITTEPHGPDCPGVGETKRVTCTDGWVKSSCPATALSYPTQCFQGVSKVHNVKSLGAFANPVK